jgi:hypothetical protein
VLVDDVLAQAVVPLLLLPLPLPLLLAAMLASLLSLLLLAAVVVVVVVVVVLLLLLVLLLPGMAASCSRLVYPALLLVLQVPSAFSLTAQACPGQTKYTACAEAVLWLTAGRLLAPGAGCG